jgi:hypothetical protein
MFGSDMFGSEPCHMRSCPITACDTEYAKLHTTNAILRTSVNAAAVSHRKHAPSICTAVDSMLSAADTRVVSSGLQPAPLLLVWHCMPPLLLSSSNRPTEPCEKDTEAPAGK